MVKVDAVVCSHHSNGTWDVKDYYYLESRQPCGTNKRGDVVKGNNIVGTNGSYEKGVGYCKFKRRLKVKQWKKQTIAWAIGPIDGVGQILKQFKCAGNDTQLFNFIHGGQQCELGDPKLCCKMIQQ